MLNNHFLSRYLDDGLVLHPWGEGEALKTHLRGVYPAALPFEFERFEGTSNVVFLDICSVSIVPLRRRVQLESDALLFVCPPGANVPRHIRIAWVRAEFIRYIRIHAVHTNSSGTYAFPHTNTFYFAASQRLIEALHWLSSPKHVIESLWIPWGCRRKHTRLQRGLPLGEEEVQCSLSQVENTDARDGGGGSPRREVVRSSAGACVVYPPFGGSFA